MLEKIIIAGAGGQGIMLLGKVLAETAMREKKFVTCLPAYGAEVRGGTANCLVIISDEEIGSPFITRADSLIIFNEPSFQRFKSRIKNKGIIFVNSSLVNSVRSSKLIYFRAIASNEAGVEAVIEKGPFTDIAFKLGNIKVANMVALGVFIAKTKLVKYKTVVKVIQQMAPKDKPELLKLNIVALKEGMSLAQ